MKKILLILMAMFALGIQNVSAQDGIKIVTNHPDFKVKVKRCVASGKTVYIDLILNNTGYNDVEGLYAWGSDGGSGSTEAYDDEGNIYRDNSIKVKVANEKEYVIGRSKVFNLPVGVPIRLSISIDSVPLSAESIARLKLCIPCEAWSIGCSKEKPVRISNIPISRD
jgi:hypothetical protein